MASASASTLAPAGLTQTTGGQAAFGPCLREEMSAADTVAALNAWGSARDREAQALRADLMATQLGITGAFSQAQVVIVDLVAAFRVEVTAMRQATLFEAQQSLALLEQVVTEARTRFDEQDVRFTAGLSELAQRLQAADAWAQQEPTRVAALVQAAPAPAWHTAPVPGTPPNGISPNPRIAMSPAIRGMLIERGASPAWANYASGPQRQQQGEAAADPSAQPQRQPTPPDAWAAYRQQHPQQPGPQQPQQPPHFNIASPPGFPSFGGYGDSGGKGGGKGDFPRDLRINSRDWGDHKKLDVATTYDRFQVWKDRATTHLSKDRPDVRALLAWADKQSQSGLATDIGAAAASFGVPDLAAVEYAIHDGIKAIVLDSLLIRARICEGRGFELWRSLPSGAALHRNSAMHAPAASKNRHGARTSASSGPSCRPGSASGRRLHFRTSFSLSGCATWPSRSFSRPRCSPPSSPEPSLSITRCG
jgi:hypothetical protein